MQEWVGKENKINKEREPAEERRKKQVIKKVDQGLAELVGVGWQKAKGAASHHPLLSILHLSADNDSTFLSFDLL